MIPLLCLLLFPTFVFAQKLTVSGQVKDALGEPVIGANVVVKGTTNGAMTDLDGMFTINEVEKGSTIVVSFIACLFSVPYPITTTSSRACVSSCIFIL